MFDWWKRRRRARKFRQRERKLEAKLGGGRARAARARVLTGWISVILAGFAAWSGCKLLLDALIYKNDALAIQHIEIHTDGTLSPETIRQWAGVRTGENLMAKNLYEVQKNLESHPAIAFAAVDKALPHTLKLTVTERRPVAETVLPCVRADGSTGQCVYQFDEFGVAMEPLDSHWRVPGPPAEPLPQLSDVSAADAVPGRRAESKQIRAALRLIVELRRSRMAGLAAFKTIDVAIPDILQATTTQGAEVTFSMDHFDTQLRRWRLISDQYLQWGRTITAVDLSIANNLPVRSVAAGGIPPAVSPPPADRPKTPRRHV